jgi:hypothetical protein
VSLNGTVFPHHEKFKKFNQIMGGGTSLLDAAAELQLLTVPIKLTDE